MSGGAIPDPDIPGVEGVEAALLGGKSLWRQVRSDKPAKPTPKLLRDLDGWLADEWPGQVNAFAAKLGPSAGSAPTAGFQLSDGPTWMIAKGSVCIAISSGLRNAKELFKETKERDDIRYFLDKYFAYVVPDRPGQLTDFLIDLARYPWFLPQAIVQRERVNDRIAARGYESWFGDHDLRARESASEAARLQLTAAVGAGNERPRHHAISSKRRQEIDAHARKTQSASYVALPVGRGRFAPANFYISDTKDAAFTYIQPLGEIIARFSPESRVAAPLLAAMVGLVERWLLPMASTWDHIYGTYVITDLLPRYRECRKEIALFLSEGIEALAIDAARGSLSEADSAVVGALRNLIGKTLEHEVVAQEKFLDYVQSTSGGRIQLWEALPACRTWPLTIKHENLASTDGITVSCEAKVRVESQNREVTWLMKAAWPQLCFALALINQCGITAVINAGNNRWGGKHPPHKTHRQGVSLDFDLAFGTDKVKDVKARSGDGRPLADDPKAGPVPNSKRPDCLIGSERLALWTAIHAFMAAGVTQFLYGDDLVVFEAASHFNSLFGAGEAPLGVGGFRTLKEEVDSVSGVSAIYEPLGHFNHLHFELFASSGELFSSTEGYKWRNGGELLLGTLLERAIERDTSRSFWSKMAGLREVPRSLLELKSPLTPSTLSIPKEEEERRWKEWWSRGKRDTTGALAPISELVGGDPLPPLLPLWSETTAIGTADFGKCPR